MVAPNLSDKGDTRPGPAHLVGPLLPRRPARVLPALTPPRLSRDDPTHTLMQSRKLPNSQVGVTIGPTTYSVALWDKGLVGWCDFKPKTDD
jgi:hypothetical protein